MRSTDVRASVTTWILDFYIYPSGELLFDRVELSHDEFRYFCRAAGVSVAFPYRHSSMVITRRIER